MRIDLSPALKRVAERLCYGESNKVIAKHLGLSSRTVEDQIARMTKRFGAKNRTQLALLLAGHAALVPERTRFVGYLHRHPRDGEEFNRLSLTDGDRQAGWTQRRLYVFDE